MNKYLPFYFHLKWLDKNLQMEDNEVQISFSRNEDLSHKS